jgi:hypothetical protein
VEAGRGPGAADDFCQGQASMGKPPKAMRLFPPDAQFMGPKEEDIPKPKSGAWVKRRTRRRAALRLYFGSLVSPMFSARAIFGYLVSIIGLLFLFGILEDAALNSRVSQTVIGIIAFISASLIWAILLAIGTPYRVRRAEKLKGTWAGERFVYREPLLVFTTEWLPTDNGNYPYFDFNDAYPGALLDYKIEVDGPTERINCIVVGAYFFRPVERVLQLARFALHGSVRLQKDRKLALACHSLPETVQAIVRVYILAWEMNETVQLDYTDVRTQTRFVLRP